MKKLMIRDEGRRASVITLSVAARQGAVGDGQIMIDHDLPVNGSTGYQHWQESYHFC
jgi:hypothetical protein